MSAEPKEFSSLIQISDHMEFIRVSNIAINNWELNANNRALKSLNKYLEEREKNISDRNNSILAKLHLKKRISNQPSTTEIKAGIYDAWKNKKTFFAWGFLSDYQMYFNDKNEEPNWWLVGDFVAIYNMNFAASKRNDWYDRMVEINTCALNKNAGEIFIDSRLYQYILTWSLKKIEVLS